MILFIDPGHGKETPGKRSPGGSFREYSFNREIAHRLCCAINSLPSLNSLTSPTSLTLSALVIVPELEDISLRERCNRVNEICRTIGTENVLLISIHANAAGNGSQWCKATGWSCYTTPDIDKNGTGNIHPSRNDVAAASMAQTVQQLVLVSDNNSAGHFGPAVPKGFMADGVIYHLHKADVSAANFFPLIEPIPSPTAEEIRKQQLLRQIAADLHLDNLFSPSGR